MHPKLNPSIKFELKESSFAYKDTNSDDSNLKPIDPLAFFVCSLCTGENNEAEIAEQLQKKIEDNGVAIKENIDLKDSVLTILNTMATAGIVMLDE